MSNTNNSEYAKLVLRHATIKDLAAIRALTTRVYKDMPPYNYDMIRGQINNFPEGTFVVSYGEAIIGYCATFRISGRKCLKPHTWYEITGGGYASTHDPLGDYLYGMEVCVDSEYRNLRIGRRLYNERKKLCKRLGLKGIVFGGRIPNLNKKIKLTHSPERYIEMVSQKKIQDPILSFQLRNGFQVIGILKDYLPLDKESLGYAAHLLWKNPELSDEESQTTQKYSSRMVDTIRVATVQYNQRRVHDFEEYARYVTYFIDVVADYNADFVCFPELFTMQLLSIDNKVMSPAASIETLTNYTERVIDLFRDLSIKRNINIIGGSHPTASEAGVKNISYVFLRDGTVIPQEKIHPTPNERYWWNIQGGSKLSAIQTDCGPIGVLICYDCEFPELARHLANQGVNIIFIPFCTDERQSYLRVRYCAQARAVENQMYVVLSGNVGNLPGVNNMDIQYAQSCILTPCDFPFARDGVAADTTPNVEMVAFADLNLKALVAARNGGTVQNLKDRRFDLYQTTWRGS